MLYESESGNLKIALAGDCIPTRRLSVFREERFLGVREIFRGAEAGFVNLETSVHEYLEGHHNISGGTYITTEPSLLEDIRWFGINIVSCAGSHSFDYGEEGVLRMMRWLRRAGIPCAGIGRNLREARSPAYLDTPRGRIALVAATSHFAEWAAAGEQRRDTPGRPGVNPLRFATTYTVDAQALSELKRIGAALGFDMARERKRNLGEPVSEISPEHYSFLGSKFVAGTTFSVSTAADPRDTIENLRQVREARGMADFVVVSLHYHEMGGSGLLEARLRSELEQPADFVMEFARRCIDEGADIFVGHGPQVPLGIEIYRGKPIFYSLGSLIFQLETVRYLPEEAYRRYGLDDDATPLDFVKARYRDDTAGHPADPLQWQQICAVCSYVGGKLNEVILYPLDLGYGKPRSQRGRPLLADEELGERIVLRVGGLSKKYGTHISFQNGVGLVSLA